MVILPNGRQVAGPSENEANDLIQQSVAPIDAGPTLRGRTFENGIVAQDAVFTPNQLDALNEADPESILTGRLDMQRVGILGLLLGGLAVGKACRMDVCWSGTSVDGRMER